MEGQGAANVIGIGLGRSNGQSRLRNNWCLYNAIVRNNLEIYIPGVRDIGRVEYKGYGI
jgi:hypothetical protein